jgi:membrane protease YdiL (CAAX protease family)
MDAEETGIIARPPRREGLVGWMLLEGAWLLLSVGLVGLLGMATESPAVLLFGLHGLVGLHVLRTERARLASWLRGSGRAVVFGLAGGLALLAFNAVYGLCLERLGVEPPDVPAFLRDVLPEPVLYLWGAGLAPVVEELYFRGRLLAAFDERLGPQAAAAVTSVAFAGIHLIPEFFPALLVFALGLLWLRRRTGGLVAPIVAHAVNNVAALFL